MLQLKRIEAIKVSTPLYASLNRRMSAGLGIRQGRQFNPSNEFEKMNMKQEKHRELIHALINCLILHPDRLTFEMQDFQDIIYWWVTPCGDDYPMIAGQKGTNIKALSFLVANLGETIGQSYNLKLQEPHPGPRIGFVQAKLSRNYDPRPARQLLFDLLQEYLTDAFSISVDAINSMPLRYTFLIEARSRPDHEQLISIDGRSLSLIDALMAVFTAYGNREGVQFRIEFK